MNARNISIAIAITISSLMTACGFAPPDPLVYDDEGNPRESVHQYEVDEADIGSCGEFEEDLAADQEGMRIPVIGADGEEVDVIAVGGLALCIDDDDEEDLDDITVEEEANPDSDRAVGLPEDGDDTIGLAPNDTNPNRTTQHYPGLISDPTPEPAGD